MVAVVGEVRPGVVEAAGRARNVTLITPEDGGTAAALRALERTEGVVAPYALVPADPLQEVARQWHRTWSGAGPDGFERAAAELLDTARGRDPLPDYYIVLTSAPNAAGDTPAPHEHDFHLGVLASLRPARVASVATGTSAASDAQRVLDLLPRLGQGPWWPPVADLIASARSFFPGRLAPATATGRGEDVSRMPLS